jgi:hypothetical protein
VFGKVYAHGVWFYFPVAFLIKSTVGVLALLLLTLGVVATRRLNRWREILFLAIPVIFYLLVALTVGMNIGVRHILVVYVFLYVLIGGATWTLIQTSRKWIYAVGIVSRSTWSERMLVLVFRGGRRGAELLRNSMQAFTND